MSDDLEGQTAEYQRVRSDLATLEQAHLQLLHKVQQDREELDKQIRQYSALWKENANLRKQLQRAATSGIELADPVREFHSWTGSYRASAFVNVVYCTVGRVFTEAFSALACIQ